MLTDNEIVKALECHSRPSNSCGSNCPYLMCEEIMCTKKLSKDALDLINRLQAENERLSDLLKRHQRNTNRIRLLTANTAKKIKSEAYREFAEKVKDKFFKIRYCESYYCVVDIDDIDNLLKELVGEGGQLVASVPTSKKEDCK